MRTAFLVFLLCIASTPVMAGKCIDYYHRATMAHDALASLDYEGEQFYSGLSQLEDDMFRYMQECKDDARLLALMSGIQITARQPSLAQLYAQKALEADPATWQSQHAMGNVLTLIREYDKAITHLETASKLAPDRVGLRLGLCRTQAFAGKHADAVRTCTQVINSDDQSMHAMAYYFRGLAYQGLGQTQAAQADENKARSLGFNR